MMLNLDSFAETAARALAAELPDDARVVVVVYTRGDFSFAGETDSLRETAALLAKTVIYINERK